MDALLKERSAAVAGIKQVLKQLAKDNLAAVYVASDIHEQLKQELLSLLEERNLPVTMVKSKADLGRMCGIAVGCAAAGVKKDPTL